MYPGQRFHLMVNESLKKKKKASDSLIAVTGCSQSDLIRRALDPDIFRATGNTLR